LNNVIYEYFKSTKFTITANQLLLVVSLYFTLVLNQPFLSGFMGAIVKLEQYQWLFLLSVPVLLFSLMVLLLAFVSIRFLMKPALVVLTLISALVFYGTLNYGVVFDYGMIENSIGTNSAEALSYLNAELLIFFFGFGVLPASLMAWVKVNYQPVLKETLQRMKLLIVSACSICLIAYAFYPSYSAVARNNNYLKKYIVPSQYLSSGYKYARDSLFYSDVKFNVIDAEPQLATIEPGAKRVTVMVVGETARAKSFSYNGYDKDTNQFTKVYDVVSFQDMQSCGTATAVSVPCMFSSLQRENFERRTADNQQNLVDLVALAGVDVLWIDNNGCKDVCKRVNTINIDVSQDNLLCDGEYCQDGILLEPLREKLANLTADSTLIVLHMMGSHGPTYFKRYPNENIIFTPECARSDIQNCSAEQLTNTYDNTIAYTDFVLSQIIGSLTTLPENVETSMLYVSDHGESLGESGAYLHGFPYALSPIEQRDIPMLVWLPEQQPEQQHQCLKQVANEQSFSHDNIFHSMLGLLNVTSSSYQQELDIFSQCTSPLNESALQLTQTGDVE
jgi:lipid A ethanolaminephosphotransferase